MSVHISSGAMAANMRSATRCASPETVIVAVTGEVDLATAPALHNELLAALNDHAPAVVDIDLSACTFLDCSGISVLVSAHATAQASGCQMWAKYPQGIVRLVLEMTGLLDVLTAPYDTAVKTATGDLSSSVDDIAVHGVGQLATIYPGRGQPGLGLQPLRDQA
jgi:anti-sigma B factor antagonist